MGSRVKQNPETTFEVYIEVSRPETNAPNEDPELQTVFPEDFSDQEVLHTVPKFCFPFSLDSYLPWFEVFYKLLNILADYSLKNQDTPRNALLDTLYRLPIPEPGTEVHLSVHSYFTVPDSRELPSIPENRNLTEYFVAVDVNNMLHLYASMLYERRILICCSKLSTLTACIHGSSSMLFPMYWQHVYIPVLPPHLLDYCCAPMPYLIGIHSSLMEKVKGMNLEDVIILNVDTNTLETPFDDLQNLPNEVISALKNRLRKVSTTTGDGVARAFLKSQASLFGSYRSALKIEPEEPITFCEETFVSHRSSGMRPFLQNAIQLQLFKQFIDGRLDLLNTGNGFSDVFEEEINMGEYAGSDKLYHQWLSTVKKGSGAFINTMKTRANPAMKTVYKFAKDHARMGIKEVKNRLKQKDLAENGCSVASEDPLPRMSPSPSAEKKDPKNREDRRPITVHFGQVRPPRPNVPRRPKSNAVVENRRTSISSPDQPQQYRTLKESDPDGDEIISPEKESDSVTEQEQPNKDINLLEDIFSNMDVESQPPLLSQAKSLEDIRTPKEDHEDHFTFDYQRMDLTVRERNHLLPTMKHSHPYNKLWGMGQDDMAIPNKYIQTSPERFQTFPRSDTNTPQREIKSLSIEKEAPSSSNQSSITIPRPHGRKTPELGIVPPPPAPRLYKQQNAPALMEPGKCQLGESISFSPQTATGPFADVLAANSNRQVSDSSSMDLLQPVKISTDVCLNDDILSLLDPLKTDQRQSEDLSTVAGNIQSCEVAHSSSTPCFGPLQSDFAPTVFPQQLGFSTQRPPFVHSPFNPFIQGMPPDQSVSLIGITARPFTTPVVSNPLFTRSVFYHSQRRPIPGFSGSGLLSQVPSSIPANPTIQQSHMSLEPTQNVPSAISGSGGQRTFPVTQPLSKPQDGKPREYPVIPPRPSKFSDAVLLPSKPGQPKDPFEELLSNTKQAVTPPAGKVEQLRKRWETFE
ncbi:DENN domain-containing protein 1A isoform 4-T4 [Mantella aurantiaca]